MKVVSLSGRDVPWLAGELDLSFRGSCGDRDFIVGNPHTFLGRISARCPHWPENEQSYSVSKSNLAEPSEVLGWWLSGYLAGNEPEPPSKISSSAWNKAIRMFHESGELPSEAGTRRFRAVPISAVELLLFDAENVTTVGGPEVQSRFCDGIDRLGGNAHTEPGKFAITCTHRPDRRLLLPAEYGDLEDPSFEALVWVSGFLSGNEVEFPLDEEGYDLEDDDPQLIAWAAAVPVFNATGRWSGPWALVEFADDAD